MLKSEDTLTTEDVALGIALKKSLVLRFVKLIIFVSLLYFVYSIYLIDPRSHTEFSRFFTKTSSKNVSTQARPDYELSFTCFLLAMSETSTLFGSTNQRFHKFCKLLKTLGFPWLFVSLGATIEVCEISMNLTNTKPAAFFYNIALAMFIVQTVFEVLAFFLFISPQWRSSSALKHDLNNRNQKNSPALIAENSIRERILAMSILFEEVSAKDNTLIVATQTSNTAAFGLLLLISVFFGFWIYETHKIAGLFLASSGCIMMNLIINVLSNGNKALKKNAAFMIARSVFRESQKLIWIIAVKQAFNECEDIALASKLGN